MSEPRVSSRKPTAGLDRRGFLKLSSIAAAATAVAAPSAVLGTAEESSREKAAAPPEIDPRDLKAGWIRM